VSELLRRFRYPLTYLALSAVCLLSMASSRAGGELGFAPRLVTGVSLPLQRMVTLPVGFARRLWTDYVALVELRQENLRLREANARLADENLQFREAIVASERFQRLLGVRGQHESSMIPANVVAQDLSPWFRSLMLDQGKSAGIQTGMPVITDQGLVGVVSGTTAGAAKVLLVTDPQSRIDAFVQRTRARATVRGRGRRACAVEYLRRDADVREGDLVITSGRGGVYPKGLVVGRIERIERKPYGLFQEAELTPAVDVEVIEEAFVLLERREVPRAAEFEAGEELFSELDR
jgi:rod shape-determining protein MreC